MTSANDLDELTNLLDSNNFNEEDQPHYKVLTKSPEPLFEIVTNLDERTKLHEKSTLNNKTRRGHFESCEFESKIGNVKLNIKSEIHNGDTDSSDDEDNRCATNQIYTETGRDIKKTLKQPTNSASFYNDSPTWKSKRTASTSLQAPAPVNTISKDVYCDPFFGIRIITPLVPSQVLKEKMAGRMPVTFSRLEKHLITYDKSSDWVLAGVIVSKFIKTSQKGNPYACWTLSDLGEDFNTLSVFLFGKAYKKLWKTSTHVVVAILNATPLEKKSTKDIAALSVMNPDQVMILGQSKDLGVCKARKKNGEPCTAFINKHQCDFCVYHVKQEYRKFSGRSELQASWGGSVNDLRNKVLGKNEVFYGGKSFTAVQAKPNRKQVVKDKNRLSQLFNNCESRFGAEPLPMTKRKDPVQSSRVLLMKDAERLQKLTGSPSTLTSLALMGHEEMSKRLPEKQKSAPRSVVNNSIKNELCKAKNDGNTLLHNKPPSKNTKNCALKSKTESQTKVSQNIAQEKRPPSAADTFNNKSKCDTVNKLQSLKPNPLDKRKKPTKNRFENLTKIKSAHSSTTKSDSVDDTEKSNNSKNSSKSPRVLKTFDMFDVCFDFEDERESRKFSNNRSTVSTTFTNKLGSKLPDGTPVKISLEEQSMTDDSISLVDGCNQSSVSDSTTNRKNAKSTLNTSVSPLGERNCPTRHESQLNCMHGTKIVEQTERRDDIAISPEKETRVKRVQDLVHTNSPKLEQFGSLSLSIPRRSSNAKINALKYIKHKGPIQKEDLVMKRNKRETYQEKKRKRLDNEDSIKVEETLLSNRFLELMNTTSKHTELISNAENQAIDEYYEKMEKKEKMEEKMLSTYQMDCKAFKCLKCKYKWFSPSELCKSENHPIKVISAVKRFFQCHNCKNRTVSLEIIPLHNCSNCASSNWKRAPMMRERKSMAVQLSIRGGEQRFVNSVESNINLNLLVPDDS